MQSSVASSKTADGSLTFCVGGGARSRSGRVSRVRLDVRAAPTGRVRAHQAQSAWEFVFQPPLFLPHHFFHSM